MSGKVLNSSSSSYRNPYDYESIGTAQLAPFLNHKIEIGGREFKVHEVVEKILEELDIAKKTYPYLESCEVCFVGRYLTHLLVKDCQTSDIDIKIKMYNTTRHLELSELLGQLEGIVENSFKELLGLPKSYRETFSGKRLCPSPLVIGDKLGIENYTFSSKSHELPVEISLNTLKNAEVPTHALNSDSFFVSFALFNGRLGSKGAGANEYRMYSLEGNCSQIKEEVRAGILKTNVVASNAFEQIWFRIIKEITVEGVSGLTTETNEQFFAKEAQAGTLIVKNMNSFIKKKVEDPLFYLLNAFFFLPPEDEFLALFFDQIQKELAKTPKVGLEWIGSLQDSLQGANPKEATAVLKELLPRFAEETSLKDEGHYQCRFNVLGKKYYVLVPLLKESDRLILLDKGILKYPQLTSSNLSEALASCSPEKFLSRLHESLPRMGTLEDKTKLSCGSLKQIFNKYQDKLETLPSAFWEDATAILSIAITEQSKAKPWKDLLMLLLPSIKETPIEEMKTFLRTLFQEVDTKPLPSKEKDPFFYPVYALAIMDKSISAAEFLEQEITDSHIEEIKKCCTLWDIEDPFNFNENFGTLLQEPEKALKLLKIQLAIEDSPEGKIRIALRAYPSCKKNPEIASFLEKEIFTKGTVEKILPVAEALQIPYQEILNERIKHNITEKKPILACNLLKCLPSDDLSIPNHLSNLLKACAKDPEKAIQAIQTNFEHQWIAILKEIKEPSLKNTLLLALSRSPNEALQEECFKAFKEDIPHFLALNKEDPLKTIKPFLVKASITEKIDLAQSCVMLPEEVDKKARQDLFNLLVTEENVESCLQEIPQTLNCFNEWMDFLKEAHLLSEPVAMQLFHRVKRIEEDSVNKLAFINSFYPCLKEEDKTICLEQVASAMQTAIDRKEPLEKILLFTTFLLKAATSEERHEKIKSDCFSFFIDNLEKITQLASSNQNRKILFEQAKIYFSAPTTALRAALVNKCLTLPYDSARVALLGATIENSENCDFLHGSSEPWDNKKIDNGLIFLQTNPENMKKFIKFASKNMTEYPTSEVIKKMGPYLEEDSRLALFEKGLEEFNKPTEDPKKTDIEKALLILLKSSQNRRALALSALENLDFYPAKILQEISSDWDEDLVSIFVKKIKIEAEVIGKLEGVEKQVRTKNYLSCFTEIKKTQSLLKNPDFYIPFARIAYPYISSLSVAEQKNDKVVALISSLIKKPIDLSSIPEENQYDALLTLFDCPSYLANQDNIQLFHAIKTCSPALIPRLSDEILTLAPEHKALWIQALGFRLESPIGEKVVFDSLKKHLIDIDPKTLKILDAFPAMPGKDQKPQSTLIVL